MPEIIVPATFLAFLAEFRPIFTAPSYANFRVLVCGFLHALGKHRVTDAIRASGASAGYAGKMPALPGASSQLAIAGRCLIDARGHAPSSRTPFQDRNYHSRGRSRPPCCDPLAKLSGPTHDAAAYWHQVRWVAMLFCCTWSPSALGRHVVMLHMASRPPPKGLDLTSGRAQDTENTRRSRPSPGLKSLSSPSLPPISGPARPLLHASGSSGAACLLHDGTQASDPQGPRKNNSCIRAPMHPG